MSSNTDDQLVEDVKNMQQTLVTSSDVAATALTFWLLALTTQLFGQSSKSEKGVRAGNAVAGVFMLFGAAAAICVTTRLYQTHYKDHGPRLFEK
jgi:hypothetical protein